MAILAVLALGAVLGSVATCGCLTCVNALHRKLMVLDD